MKKAIIYFGLALTITIWLLLSCKKDVVENYDNYIPTPVEIEYPQSFPDLEIPTDNSPTKEAIALGRSLYYDKILHKNQVLSCSACHDQNNAFTTMNSNSLAHINLGWNHSFLWNGKIQGTLEDIMLFEVEDFFETNIELLNSSEKYRVLFKKAYGVDSIASQNVAFALAQFFRTLNSFNSRYDKQMQGIVNFTIEEYEGFDIFYTERGDCFHCHGTSLLHDNLFHNNGLDASPDLGLYMITQNSDDLGKFKTPTLRNIELTAPYMHDGRFQSLEEVVDFYCDNLNYSPTISPLMKNVGQGGVNLTPYERVCLIAFLKTLTDDFFITNPALGAP